MKEVVGQLNDDDKAAISWIVNHLSIHPRYASPMEMHGGGTVEWRLAASHPVVEPHTLKYYRRAYIGDVLKFALDLDPNGEWGGIKEHGERTRFRHLMHLVRSELPSQESMDLDFIVEGDV
jgi:hypothetical protein